MVCNISNLNLYYINLSRNSKLENYRVVKINLRKLSRDECVVSSVDSSKLLKLISDNVHFLVFW